MHLCSFLSVRIDSRFTFIKIREKGKFLFGEPASIRNYNKNFLVGGPSPCTFAPFTLNVFDSRFTRSLVVAALSVPTLWGITAATNRKTKGFPLGGSGSARWLPSACLPHLVKPFKTSRKSYSLTSNKYSSFTCLLSPKNSVARVLKVRLACCR